MGGFTRTRLIGDGSSAGSGRVWPPQPRHRVARMGFSQGLPDPHELLGVVEIEHIEIDCIDKILLTMSRYSEYPCVRHPGEATALFLHHCPIPIYRHFLYVSISHTYIASSLCEFASAESWRQFSLKVVIFDRIASLIWLPSSAAVTEVGLQFKSPPGALLQSGRTDTSKVCLLAPMGGA